MHQIRQKRAAIAGHRDAVAMITQRSKRTGNLWDLPGKGRAFGVHADEAGPQMRRVYVFPSGEHILKVRADEPFDFRISAFVGKNSATHAKEEATIWHEAEIMQEITAIESHSIRGPSGRVQFIVALWAGDKNARLHRQIARGEPVWNVLGRIPVGGDYQTFGSELSLRGV